MSPRLDIGPLLVAAVVVAAFALVALTTTVPATEAETPPTPDPTGGGDGTVPDPLEPLAPDGTPDPMTDVPPMDMSLPEDQGTGSEGSAGPMTTDIPPNWLPGDNHDFDNQFLFAAGAVLNDPGQANPDTWRFALFCKLLAWREQGRSWTWSCTSHNTGNPPGAEDSRGLMQVNVLAHPEFAGELLFDCNQNILVAAQIAADAWGRGGGNPLIAGNLYNSGRPNLGYGSDIQGQFRALAQALPVGAV